MLRSQSVPPLVIIVDRKSKLATEASVETKRTPFILSATNIDAKKRSLKRVVSDISMTFTDSEECRLHCGASYGATIHSQGGYDDDGFPRVERIGRNVTLLNTQAGAVLLPFLEKRHVGQLPLHSARSSWFLPLGRPLAAAPKLLCAKYGTAISKQEARFVGKKRRRTPWGEHRKCCRKVAISASLGNENMIIDAAVTLSRLSTGRKSQETGSSGFQSAMPPPPFQLFRECR